MQAKLALAIVILASVPVSAGDDVTPTSACLVAPDAERQMDGSCPFIQPGTRIVNERGGSCTLAWILDGSDGHTYAATAGHCGAKDTREFHPATGQWIGKFVYAVDAPIGEDFGLIRVEPSAQADVRPEMCNWGAPTGTYESGDGPAQAVHFGFGIGTGTHPWTRARTGFMDYENGHTFGLIGAAAPGDSGSPVMAADGRAIGVLTDGTSIRPPDQGPELIPADPALWGQPVLGTLLEHGIARAESDLGVTFTLRTA